MHTSTTWPARPLEGYCGKRERVGGGVSGGVGVIKSRQMSSFYPVLFGIFFLLFFSRTNTQNDDSTLNT